MTEDQGFKYYYCTTPERKYRVLSVCKHKPGKRPEPLTRYDWRATLRGGALCIFGEALVQTAERRYDQENSRTHPKIIQVDRPVYEPEHRFFHRRKNGIDDLCLIASYAGTPPDDPEFKELVGKDLDGVFESEFVEYASNRFEKCLGNVSHYTVHIPVEPKARAADMKTTKRLLEEQKLEGTPS